MVKNMVCLLHMFYLDLRAQGYTGSHMLNMVEPPNVRTGIPESLLRGEEAASVGIPTSNCLVS